MDTAIISLSVTGLVWMLIAKPLLRSSKYFDVMTPSSLSIYQRQVICSPRARENDHIAVSFKFCMS